MSLTFPPHPPKRTYDKKMRDAGLRRAEIWVPDRRDPDFIEKCRRQSLAIAASDPATN